MGLDATVYCNCFERGLIKEPPPSSSVIVSDDGSLECRSEDLDTLLAFDNWRSHRACDHPSGILIHHRIGNLAQVGLLRSELEREAVSFPILLTKVLYSGTHGGDHLTMNDIAALQVELDRLGGFACPSPPNQEYVDWFRQQMIELVQAATHVRKPIAF